MVNRQIEDASKTIAKFFFLEKKNQHYEYNPSKSMII